MTTHHQISHATDKKVRVRDNYRHEAARKHLQQPCPACGLPTYLMKYRDHGNIGFPGPSWSTHLFKPINPCFLIKKLLWAKRKLLELLSVKCMTYSYKTLNMLDSRGYLEYTTTCKRFTKPTQRSYLAKFLLQYCEN
jgi:hypothetical protein